MQQRTKNKTSNDIRITSQSIPRMTRKSIMGMMLYWTLMAGLMLFQQLPTASAAYKDDPCETKSQPGLCKDWSDCPLIKTLIEKGEYTKREVVSCGFGIREEMICCPVIKTDTKIDVTSSPPTVATTSAAEPRDFWLDVLDDLKSNSTTTTATTTTTTQKPDFWLDLLSTTTTTTTTVKPLVIGDKRLDQSSEYFDFSQLLSGKSERQRSDANPSTIATNNQPNTDNSQSRDNFRNNDVPATDINSQDSSGGSPNQGNNANLPTNFNTGPVNVNQWNFDSNNGQGNFGPGNSRGHANGHIGRGQQNFGPGNNFQNINYDNFQNNGRGNRGRGHNKNRNFHNNARRNVGNGQNDNQFHNQNQGFAFPSNNNNGAINLQNPSPDQNWAASNVNNQIVAPPDNNNEHARVNHIINSVLQTPENSNHNQASTSTNMDDVIWNIFNEQPHPNAGNSNPTVLWLNNAESTVSEVEYVNPHYQPLAVTHEQLTMQPTELVEMHVDSNDLETSPSSHIVAFQQLDSGHNWPHEPAQPPAVDPIQTVYGNLVNSGMQILKAKADFVERAYQQHQQQHFGSEPTNIRNPHQFGQPGSQQVRHEPQFRQQPQFGQQQAGQQQQFGQQQVGQQPQFEQQINRPQQFEQHAQFGQQPNRHRQFEQQAQFGRHPNHEQQFEQQSHFAQRQPSGLQQFGQQSQFGQRPQTVNHQPSQHFEQQSQFTQQPSQSQQLQEPTQQGPQPKQPRTANQFIQVPPHGPQAPNVQTAPANILDPFKPFEFRPPPADELVFQEGDNSIRPSSGPVTNKERPAVRACQRILKGLYPGLTPHILGGTPAELGEFPHMVAIGYSRLGDDGQGPYDIRCGGTLIDSRFVLTAAHCVSARDSVPSIVRMGVVNFTDPNAMQDAVEIRIKEIFIHDDYSQRSTYNDIAILELERAPPLGEFIAPVCLYTDEADPKPEVKLWVTGWGTVNTSTRAYSDILLKAPLHVTPLERCNASFVDYGLTRQIDQGIIKTQMCAEDKEQIRDACQGDSGGPLNLVIDEAYKNYRLVGVVSSGFGCASSTPGLYTRVAAFLDFIEKICWPNGGD